MKTEIMFAAINMSTRLKRSTFIALMTSILQPVNTANIRVEKNHQTAVTINSNQFLHHKDSNSR